jgi:hypothetical protein
MSSSRCLLIATYLAAYFIISIPNEVSSKTWYINSLGTGDAPTIQAGIDSASTGDTLSLADGTYMGDGNRNINLGGKAVTVQSQSGNPNACILDVEGTALSPHWAFQMSSGETASTVLNGMTIRGGYYFSGGVLIDNASPTITHCIFVDNTATIGGGAIGIGHGAPLIRDCTFEANTAQVGGALYCNNASPTLQFCEFKYDSAVVSGGAFASEHGSPTLENCRFMDNWAGEDGGAIRCFYDDDVTLSDLYLAGNEAGQVGGGMSLEDIVAGDVTGCILTVNAAQAGGALHVAGNVTLSTCTMYENTAAQYGGAIIYAGASLDVRSCTLSGNSALMGAGIACVDDQEVTVSSTCIVFSAGGEAVYCFGGAKINLDCCDVYGNAGGDWIGCITAQDTLPGNFSEDPEFCGIAGSGNFELQSDSPCAPGNHPKGADCDVIGARPVGCGTTPVESTTWGNIKSLFNQK